MTYNFLVLSLLFLIPGVLVFALRPDLRPVIGLMAVCSIPFAFTESLFYPSYWEPKFLFDLADRIGFGVEDIIFVVGLGAFTSTAYAFTFRRRYLGGDEEAWIRAALLRCLALFGATGALVLAAVLAGIPMIYGSCVIMIGLAGVIWWRRTDLALPSLLGGGVSLLVYTGLCLIFGWLIPDVFRMAWHTEKFLNIFVLGVPLEELMYGFAAGTAATAFYPYVFGRRFGRLESTTPLS